MNKKRCAVKTALLSALLLAGCSASRPESLEQAQENLQRAQQDAQITANAQAPLYDAAQSYTRAEKAWKDGADRVGGTYPAQASTVASGKLAQSDEEVPTER